MTLLMKKKEKSKRKVLFKSWWFLFVISIFSFTLEEIFKDMASVEFDYSANWLYVLVLII